MEEELDTKAGLCKAIDREIEDEKEAIVFYAKMSTSKLLSIPQSTLIDRIGNDEYRHYQDLKKLKNELSC